MKLATRFKNLSSKNKVILKNTIGAFVVKGFALIVSLLTTPAYIKYFKNDAVLGVWYTLLSVLIWFLNFDLGIGNGIRNNLVEAFSNNDRLEAKRIISSGLFSVLLVSAFLVIGGVVLIFFCDLNWLFNISSNVISYEALRRSVIFVFCAIMLRFLLTFVSSIFYALQQSAVNNFLTLCVSILQLLFVLVFHFENQSTALVALSIAYLVLSNLPLLLAGVIIFLTILKDCKPNFKFITKEHSKKVMGIGGVFFICQITYMLISNTNEFLITKLFSPEYTTEYSFYYKLTSLVSMVVTLAMTPIWSIVTKAFVEKDFLWLRKLYRIIKIVGMCSILLQFLAIPFLQTIMDIWLGKGIVNVDYLTAVAFACFGSVFVYSGMLSTIVCGMARMKLQTIFYSGGVIIKFVLVLIAARVWGANWSIVVWSNAIILLPYCIAQQIDLDIYFKKQIKEKIELEIYEEL